MVGSQHNLTLHDSLYNSLRCAGHVTCVPVLPWCCGSPVATAGTLVWGPACMAACQVWYKPLTSWLYTASEQPVHLLWILRCSHLAACIARLLPWPLAPPTLQCLRPSLRTGSQECGCSSHQQLGYDARGLQGAVCERMVRKRQAELAAGPLPTITAADGTRLLGAFPAPACNCCKRVLCGCHCMPNTTAA